MYRMKRLLLLAALVTACTPSPEVAYTAAIQEALDSYTAKCNRVPKPWCVGPVKVTGLYETEPYDNAVARKYSEAAVTRFYYKLEKTGFTDNGVAYMGKENGRWAVYAAASGRNQIFDLP